MENEDKEPEQEDVLYVFSRELDIFINRFVSEWDITNMELVYALEKNLYYIKHNIWMPNQIVEFEIGEDDFFDGEYEEGEED